MKILDWAVDSRVSQNSRAQFDCSKRTAVPLFLPFSHRGWSLGAKTEIRNSSVKINACSVKINRGMGEVGEESEVGGAYFYTPRENTRVRTARRAIFWPFF